MNSIKKTIKLTLGAAFLVLGGACVSLLFYGLVGVFLMVAY